LSTNEKPPAVIPSGPSTPARRFQATSAEGIRFAPSGLDNQNFIRFTHRINAAGGHPNRYFPGRVAFRGVSLVRTNLNALSFDGADLSYADLKEASMVDSKSLKANLSYSNLTGVVIARGAFAGADFTGALQEKMTIGAADLTGAKGYTGPPAR
jgi:hypothetical protein